MKRKIETFLMLCALIFLGYVVGSWTTRQTVKDANRELSAIVVKQQLIDIQELALTEYHYTNMAQFVDYVDFYGFKVPFTTKKFIVSYDGTIKAGIDFSAIELEITEKTLYVRLPETRILSHDIDDSSLRIFDEASGLFNPLTLSDINQFNIDQKQAMEEKALESSLLSEAQSKAESVIEQWLRLFLDEYGYQIVFR